MFLSSSRLKQITMFGLGASTMLLFSTSGFAQSSLLAVQNPVTVPQIQRSQPLPVVDNFPTTYREAKKDPFSTGKIERSLSVTPTLPPSIISVIAPPSFEERDMAWREARNNTRIHSSQPEPFVLEKYLVNEVKVLGLYQKPEGQGVFLKPTVTAGTTIFAMVGQKFWNGQIIRIDKDKIEVEVTTLISNGSTTQTKKEIQTIPFTRTK